MADSDDQLRREIDRIYQQLESLNAKFDSIIKSISSISLDMLPRLTAVETWISGHEKEVVDKKQNLDDKIGALHIDIHGDRGVKKELADAKAAITHHALVVRALTALAFIVTAAVVKLIFFAEKLGGP